MRRREMPRTGAQDRARRRIVADEREQPRAHRLGRQMCERISRENAVGHCRRGGRREAVDADIVFLALYAERLHQPDERHLRRAVIGLPEIAVKARRGGRHHDTAEAALAKERKSVVWGKRGTVGVRLGGGGEVQKKKKK